MYLDIEIYPYKIEQRTEYSKIKIFNMKENKDVSNNTYEIEIVKKILSDYFKQKEAPERYFNIQKNALLNDININADNIKYVFVPENVTSIEEQAFKYSDIELVKLPNNLKKIDKYVFYNCKHLKHIYIPKSVSEINCYSFEGCDKLESVVLKAKIHKIQGRTFFGCESLKEITIADEVTDIGAYAFFGCKNLKKINFNEKLKTIRTNAFGSCSSLEKISLPSFLNEISVEAFFGCSMLKNIEMPDAVTEINQGAFRKCVDLEEVKLSNNINTLFDEVFDGCKNLKNIKLSDSILELHEKIFAGCEKLENINIPKNLESINGSPFAYSPIRSLTFDYDLKDLCDSSWDYENYDLLTNTIINKLIISKNVRYITPDAFKYSGGKIKTIDYKGSKEEFEEFKNNNKKLFDLFTNLEKVNFIEDKEKENIKMPTAER